MKLVHLCVIFSIIYHRFLLLYFSKSPSLRYFTTFILFIEIGWIFYSFFMFVKISAKKGAFRI